MRTLLLLPALALCLSAQTVSYKDLKYPPLGTVKLPEITQFTLPNGMRVYLLENHDVPMVRGLALVRTGNLFDTKDKIGLATMTGIVMRSGGTASKTGDQLDEQLENIAASVETGISESSGTVSFSSLKENTSEVLGVVKDVLLHPEFRQDKIDLAKTELRSGIARRNDDPAQIAQREFTNILYGRDTPYGWEMTFDTVNRIQRRDLQAFYQRYFFPANMMFAVQGDFQTAEMKAAIEKLFADWNAKQAPVPPFPALPPAPAGKTYLVTKQDVTQTVFFIGQRGGLLKDPDYPVLEVMGDILGGGFDSRLVRKVRSELGYAYGISADWGGGYNSPGLFVVNGSTKSLSTTEAIDASLKQIEKMQTGEVTEAELEDAKSKVANSFVFNFDTPSKTLNRLLTYEYYGYPRDFVFQYQKAVGKVTRAEVQRVAKKYLDPAEMTIVAVGNPKEFGAKLESLGRPVTPLDVSNAGAAGAVAAVPAASPEKVEAGKKALAAVRSQSGGAKLEGITDWKQTMTVKLAAQAGGVTVTQTESWKKPNLIRQEVSIPGQGQMVVFGDGQTGFMAAPQGSMELRGPQMRQLRAEMFRFYPTLLLSDQIPGRTVSEGAEGRIEVSDGKGETIELTVDPASGLLRTAAFDEMDPSGPVKLVQTYTSYQDVDGVKLPKTVTVTRNGQPYAEVTVSDVRINSGLKDADLSKKPQ